MLEVEEPVVLLAKKNTAHFMSTLKPESRKLYEQKMRSKLTVPYFSKYVYKILLFFYLLNQDLFKRFKAFRAFEGYEIKILSFI